MSVTGKKGRDKSSVGRFGCQARSACVTTVYILTQTVWVPPELHDSSLWAGCYRSAPSIALKQFLPKGSWEDLHHGAWERLVQGQSPQPGYGEGVGQPLSLAGDLSTQEDAAGR